MSIDRLGLYHFVALSFTQTHNSFRIILLRRFCCVLSSSFSFGLLPYSVKICHIQSAFFFSFPFVSLSLSLSLLCAPVNVSNVTQSRELYLNSAFFLFSSFLLINCFFFVTLGAVFSRHFDSIVRGVCKNFLLPSKSSSSTRSE